MPRKIVKFGVRSSEFGVKELFLCFFSAATLIFSFPRFNIWLFAWFGFVPLFIAIKDKPKGKAFLLSYITGIIFWCGTIYWLIHVTLPGTIILALYLALYFGLFGLYIKFSELRTPNSQLLAIPSAWVLLEYIRSHLFTGFPWALLGFSQYQNLPIIQIADITGAWGVSFLVMMVNAALFIAVRKKQRLSLPTVISILLCVLVYGYFKIYSLQLKAYNLKLKVSVIQGNIPQELKWDPLARDFIIEKYFALSRKAAKDNPDIIIWPEAAWPEVLEGQAASYEALKKFTQELDLPLVLGIVTSEGDIYHNSALLFSRNGGLTGRYDKLHLVPFGEYIPLKKSLPFLETIVPIGDITAGKEYKIFNLQTPNSKLQADFSVLICFEDLFPGLSREFVKRGADFLVNITNDAWYMESSAARQHLQASVFRAAENRVYLARAANTGVSAFIAPTGRIISLVQDNKSKEIFVEGSKTQEILIPERPLTFYTRFGDVFIIICLVLVVYGIIPILQLKAYSLKF